MRLPNFYQKSLSERLAVVAQAADLDPAEQAALAGPGLTPDVADHMIENVVGVFGLPLGVAVNFLINGRECLIPMAVEEPSIVASASFMAKLARAGGGFVAHSDPPEGIGQLHVLDVPDLPTARLNVLAAQAELLALANAVHPNLQARGGGARRLEARLIENSPVGPFLVVHVVVDTRDAMGANLINTMCEALAPRVAELTGGRVHLRILSNLTDTRLVRAQCRIPTAALAFEGYSGAQVQTGILEAYAFAAADPYRAATHNKGIMNGIDPVVLATGNDWRAVEAGAHAFAARSGRYTSLSTWGRNAQGDLVGTLELPLAVGIVGGATRVHPTAQAALKLLKVTSATELAEVMACVGLAQNLAALRALATEGIQRGHMSLHARQVALAAGAAPHQVEALAAQLVAEGHIKLDRARELLARLT